MSSGRGPQEAFLGLCYLLWSCEKVVHVHFLPNCIHTPGTVIMVASASFDQMTIATSPFRLLQAVARRCASGFVHIIGSV